VDAPSEESSSDGFASALIGGIYVIIYIDVIYTLCAAAPVAGSRHCLQILRADAQPSSGAGFVTFGMGIDGSHRNSQSGHLDV
jgi:hypothetical protein